MKKRKVNLIWVTALAALLVFPLSLNAQGKRIAVNQLPKKAVTFLTKHVDVTSVTQCKIGDRNRSYEVDLSNGTEIEFDVAGEWTEFESEKVPIPSSVMVLLPSTVNRYIEMNYPGIDASKLERTRSGYEVTLKTEPYKTELKFDKKGVFKSKEIDR